MLLMQVDEATAARRRIPVHLVDATDGITPETGEAAGQPQVSKVGDTTPAWTNTTATLTAIGNGAYYLEFTVGEVDTIGVGMLRYKSANTAEFQIAFQVVSFDPYDAVRMGMTALPNAVPAGADGLPTVDASNLVAGIQGTKNALDDLNDIAAGAAMDLITNALDAAAVATDAVTEIQSGLATAAAVAALNDLSAAQVNTEVDNALDTALPGSPTADSINEVIKKLAGAALVGDETAGSLFRLFYDIIKPVGDRTNNDDLDSLLGVPDTAALTVVTELQQYVVVIGVAQSGTVWYFRTHLELNGQVITSGCTNGTLDAYDENSAQIGIQQTDATPDAQHCFVFEINDTPTADRPHYADAGIDYGGITYPTRLQLATAD
jgi:hypothetical protein